MIERCYNPSHKAYARYGGQGIGVDPLFRYNPVAFMFYCDRVLGPRPEGHTLDRLNVYLGYTVGNLRWADDIKQNNNKQQHYPIPASDADDSRVFAKMEALQRGFDLFDAAELVDPLLS